MSFFHVKCTEVFQSTQLRNSWFSEGWTVLPETIVLATLLSEIQSHFSQLSATVLARVLPSNKDLLSTLLVLCVFQITTLNNTFGVVSWNLFFYSDCFLYFPTVKPCLLKSVSMIKNKIVIYMFLLAFRVNKGKT